MDTSESEQHNKIYCAKCKNHTENLEVKIEPQTMYRLKSKCAVCFKKKNKYHKSVPIEIESTKNN